MTDQPVTSLVQDGVGIVTISRPDVLNALDDPTMASLADQVRDVATRDEVGCVVLTGAGRAFCAGGDLKMYEGASGKRLRGLTREQRVAELRGYAEASRLLHETEKVTIAMVNGPCAGAGISLAFACDLRFAASSAVFRTAFLSVGLGGDYGSAYFLTKALGSARARELILLGEKLDAAAALARGMVASVHPDDELREATLALARRFATKAPWAARYAKENLNAALAGDLPGYLDREAANMVAAHADIGRELRAKAPRAGREQGGRE